MLKTSLNLSMLLRSWISCKKFCIMCHKANFEGMVSHRSYASSSSGYQFTCQKDIPVSLPKLFRNLNGKFNGNLSYTPKTCYQVRHYKVHSRQRHSIRNSQSLHVCNPSITQTIVPQVVTVISRNVVTEKTLAAENPLKIISAAAKKRVARKKALEKEMIADHKNMAAYAVGNELFIDRLEKALQEQNLYEIVKLPVDITDTLMATAKYRVDGKAREIYFFEDGSVVCWNMPASERLEVVKFAQKYCETPHETQLILDESEMMNVVTDSITTLKGNTLHIRGGEDSKPELNNTILLEKFAFSNAVAQSVTLSMKEVSLDAFVESIEPKTQDLRDGKDVHMTRRSLNKKLGEVFLLRHDINLSSDFLDTPDVYWEREELEILYKSMCTYLNIPKRTKVMNEKLNYCTQILELFSSQMNDERHVRLEWFIIALILVEVIFETMHYIERYLDRKEIENRFMVEETSLADQSNSSGSPPTKAR